MDTPLPIGEDVKELLSHQGFLDNAFVLEVSHVLLGDPQALARRVWDLDRLEEEYIDLKKDMEKILNGIKNDDDRHNKGYNGIEEIKEKHSEKLPKLIPEIEGWNKITYKLLNAFKLFHANYKESKKFTEPIVEKEEK